MSSILEKELALLSLERTFWNLKYSSESAYNIFDVLGIKNETQISTLLANLFNWSGKIQEGDSFLKCFLRLIGITTKGLDYRIVLEQDICDRVKNERSRLDILIEGDDFVVLVENKINQQAYREHQISTAIRHLHSGEKWIGKRIVYVFLAPTSLEGKYNSETRLEKTGSSYFMSWGKMALLLESLFHCTTDQRLSLLVNDFIKYIYREMENEKQ